MSLVSDRRLSRQMCGRPKAFRQISDRYWGSAPEGSSFTFGKAQSFRTSSGKAATKDRTPLYLPIKSTTLISPLMIFFFAASTCWIVSGVIRSLLLASIA